MKDFAFLWLLFNTNWGKTLLYILVVLAIIAVLEWWTVPVIAVLLAAFFLWEIMGGSKDKWGLIIGVSLIVFAVLFSLGIIFYSDINRWYRGLTYHEPPVEEVYIESEMPDTIIVTEEIEWDSTLAE